MPSLLACRLPVAPLRGPGRPAPSVPRRRRPAPSPHPRPSPPAAAPASPPSDSSASSSSVFPPYTLLPRSPAYDLRLYTPHWILSTPYTRRDEGFERLGAYGAGANGAGARAPAAAQPVVMWFPSRSAADASASASVDKRMTLHIVGAGVNGGVAPPPPPTTPGVSLGVGGGEVLAVSRFEGYATPDATLAALDALLAALSADGVKLGPEAEQGAFRLAQYGPLFTLETRVNEVQVPVQLNVRGVRG